MTEMETYLLKYLANTFIDQIDEDDIKKARKTLVALECALKENPLEGMHGDDVKTEKFVGAIPGSLVTVNPASEPDPSPVATDSLGNQI